MKFSMLFPAMCLFLIATWVQCQENYNLSDYELGSNDDEGYLDYSDVEGNATTFATSSGNISNLMAPGADVKLPLSAVIGGAQSGKFQMLECILHCTAL